MTKSAADTRQRRVSIHAPHEGERPDGADNVADLAHVSIHAPHEGERPLQAVFFNRPIMFQSTLPTRGSDLLPVAAVGIDLRFNPRSPRGGATSRREYQNWRTNCFNPRSPRGGATQVA